MKKEKRISYKAGITRTPSDFLCQDGELAECINLTTDNEELKVMVEPQVVKPASYKLLFVHKLPDGRENEIYDDGSHLLFENAPLTEHTSEIGTDDITAIGKTLTVTADGKLRYFVWKVTDYVDIGELPSLSISPALREATWNLDHESKSFVETKQKGDGVLKTSGGDLKGFQDGKQDEFNTLIAGLYAGNKKRVAQKKGFCNPFFVRAALEMYDNTYTMVTNPILMFPSVNRSSYGYYDSGYLTLLTHYCLLLVTQTVDYSDYSDIIKDIVIFVSDDIDLYDTTSDQSNSIDKLDSEKYVDAISLVTDSSTSIRYWRPKTARKAYDLPLKRSRNEIANDITSTGIFYKLCSIGLKPVSHLDLSKRIGAHDLENLTNQTRLEHDDYYSRCPMWCDMLHAYNARLNISGVKRGFFDGFKEFMPLESEYGKSEYEIFVRIKTESGERVVRQTLGPTNTVLGPYFFYPDSRANHVTIRRRYGSGWDCILDEDLKEHPRLNGAYYYDQEFGSDMDKYVSSSSYWNAVGLTPTLTAADATPEELGGYLLQSEVYNPFVYQSSGYHRVGTGRIMAMRSVTMALSQDQFGRTDLVVFSDNGLWGMQVDKTGLYDSSHPLSREVCLNPECVVQTDSAVFFVSKKGLMMIDENGRVGCVSESVNGRAFSTESIEELQRQTLESYDSASAWAVTVDDAEDGTSFQDFLISSGSCIAYDYVDSRLLLFNPHKWYCWVYSLKDGSFSKMTLSKRINNVVNNYPDYLLQDENKAIYTLYGKKREDEDTTRKTAFLLTRPMKLAGPLTVTSLKELVNVGLWDEKAGSVVKTEVFVSDNLRDWYLKESRFGAAAKYYRLALFVRMRPSERLSGTIVMEEERRNENMRR